MGEGSGSLLWNSARSTGHGNASGIQWIPYDGPLGASNDLKVFSGSDLPALIDEDNFGAMDFVCNDDSLVSLSRAARTSNSNDGRAKKRSTGMAEDHKGFDSHYQIYNLKTGQLSSTEVVNDSNAGAVFLLTVL